MDAVEPAQANYRGTHERHNAEAILEFHQRQYDETRKERVGLEAINVDKSLDLSQAAGARLRVGSRHKY